MKYRPTDASSVFHGLTCFEWQLTAHCEKWNPSHITSITLPTSRLLHVQNSLAHIFNTLREFRLFGVVSTCGREKPFAYVTVPLAPSDNPADSQGQLLGTMSATTYFSISCALQAVARRSFYRKRTFIHSLSRCRSSLQVETCLLQFLVVAQKLLPAQPLKESLFDDFVSILPSTNARLAAQKTFEFQLAINSGYRAVEIGFLVHQLFPGLV